MDFSNLKAKQKDQPSGIIQFQVKIIKGTNEAAKSPSTKTSRTTTRNIST